MADFINNHYLIIMIVAAFLILALIGFIVDNMRNKNKDDGGAETIVEENMVTEIEADEAVDVPSIEEETDIVESVPDEAQQEEQQISEPEEIIVEPETEDNN